jgi:hypothetical protein
MVAITFGNWVFLDRHYGIAVGAPEKPGTLFAFRDALLKNCERLLEIEGVETIIDIVARHLGTDSEGLSADIRLAEGYFQHPFIRECWHGGAGPLSKIDADSITVERLNEIIEVEEIKLAGRLAKTEHTRRRRSQFNAVRSDLMLAMLDSGIPYVCASAGCAARTNLTIDHKRALSRGGTDDIGNLQFMCASHNSQKRDGP